MRKHLALSMVAGAAACSLASLNAANVDPLEQSIRKLDAGACLEAGDRGRVDLISALEVAAQECDQPLSFSCSAPRQALAKLGVSKYLNEILTELTATTNSAAYRARLEIRSHALSPGRARVDAEWATKIEALKKLGYVRNKSTVKAIAAILYDNTDWKSILPKDGDAWYIPPPVAAAQALSEMKLDNPPPGNPMWDVKAWQQWWEQNKDKYP